MEGGNGVEQGEGGDGVEQGGGWRRSGAGLRATTERRRRGGPRSGPGRRSGVVARSPAERSRHPEPCGTESPPEALRNGISTRNAERISGNKRRLDNPPKIWTILKDPDGAWTILKDPKIST